MDCCAVRAELLAPEPGGNAEVVQHVASCITCARLSAHVQRLDELLRPTLLVEPPCELQERLVALARASARPASQPAASTPRVGPFSIPALSLSWLRRPQLAFAQLSAALLVSLAGWQLLGWMQVAGSVIGDVPYALQLLFSSPAAAYLANVQIDVQNVVLWSAIGGGAWLISEAGPLHHLVVARERI